MEFSRRHTPTVADISKPHKPSTRRLLAAAGVVSLLIASGFIAYTHRQDLAARFYPTALNSMALADHQIKGEWATDLPDNRLGAAVTFYMLRELATLCAVGPHIIRNAEATPLSAKLDQILADPTTAPNLYGDRSLTTAKRLEQIKRNKASFCAKDYPVAVHDATFAHVTYVNRVAAINRKTLARINYALAVSKSLIRKTLSHEPLSQHEQLMHSCANLHEQFGQDSNACFWNTMIARKEVPEDEIADLKTGLIQLDKFVAKSASSAASTSSGNTAPRQASYSSPSVDYRAYCRRVHENYEYREICERNQQEALDQIRGMNVPDEVARYCDRVHNESYEYRKICYENQMAAKSRNDY